MTSDHPVKRRKKLIEVAIPLEAINAASARRRCRPTRIGSDRCITPCWLALPADWQEHPVVRHTARELGRMGGPQQLEG